jgi:predicted MFS family arabinose efflux permease
VLGRRLDRSFAPEVRANVTAVTLGRLTGNAAYRFSGPFLGAIARGMHVTLGQIGVAVAVGETSGLLSPLTGRLVDRLAPRRAMWWGLVGVAAGASAAGSAPNLVAFAAGLFLLGWAKSVYDIGLGAWIAGHVAYERRSRVVGLTETSWALGLLVGVSLMGLITGVASPRWAYAAAAVVVVVMAGVLRHRLPEDHTAEARPVGVRIGRISRSGMVVVGGMLLLAAGAQALFVTFGSWLQDQHGFSSTTLAVVTFGLGAAELAASLTSAHRTDAWGKERSVAVGAAAMVPAALALAAAQRVLPLGLAAVVVAIVMFEFAIVSGIALASELVPGSAARGLAWVVSATTLGRALVAIPATKLYQHLGIDGPAVLTAALAAGAVVAFARPARSRST